MSDDEDNLVGSAERVGEAIATNPDRELGELLDDLEALLKSGDVISVLTGRGINASIALLVVDGLRAYLAGDKTGAAEDLGTAAEEIRVRLAAAVPSGSHSNGHGGSR